MYEVTLDPVRLRGFGIPVHAVMEAIRSANQDVGAMVLEMAERHERYRRLVDRLPELLGLRFSALYLVSDRKLLRQAGPESLPEELPIIGILHDQLKRQGSLVKLDELAPLRLLSPEVEMLSATLGAAGVELAGLRARLRPAETVVLICGGTDKNLDLEPLKQACAAAHDVFLLPGTATDLIMPDLKKRNIPFSGPYDSMDQAVSRAAAAARSRGGVARARGVRHHSWHLSAP